MQTEPELGPVFPHARAGSLTHVTQLTAEPQSLGRALPTSGPEGGFTPRSRGCAVQPSHETSRPWPPLRRLQRLLTDTPPSRSAAVLRESGGLTPNIRGAGGSLFILPHHPAGHPEGRGCRPAGTQDLRAWSPSCPVLV